MISRNLVKNTLAVLAGVSVALTTISLGLMINKQWFGELNNIKLQTIGDIFIYWKSILAQAPTNFFIALLVAYGIGSILGGMITAFFVQKAKKAYAMFIGFILFGIAIIDCAFIAEHPTWYFICLLFVFFPFSWLGGKITEELRRNR